MGGGGGGPYLSFVVFQLISLDIRCQKFPFEACYTLLVLFQLGLSFVGSFKSSTVKVPLTVQLLCKVLQLDP